MTFKQILSRLTGISCPVFGIQWNPPEPEISVAQRVISFLEDRRVLFNPFNLEFLAHCVQSVIEIRRFLTNELGNLSAKNSGLSEQLRAMRAACRRFLDSVQDRRKGRTVHPHRGAFANEEFFTALGELRAAMGLRIGILAVMYGLSIEGELESILPPKPKKGDG
jgi:hypothetical protein